MTIRIQSIHFDADKKLLDFIEKKAQKLEQFSDNILDGEVYLKLDKSIDDANKISEIKVSLPGQTLFAKSQCKSFEEATEQSIESLKRQINRFKEKQKEH